MTHGVVKHGSADFARIAEEGTILRTEVGSGAHGIAIEGTDDRDEMGICIEPAEYVIGLKTGEGNVPFGQYIYRTKPEHARSGPGDLDLTIYSLRKWMKLAMGGNPSVLIPLFVPRQSMVTCREAGLQLRHQADRIISRRAGYQFLGYLNNQRESMTGVRKPKVNRPELVEKYGFDTKYASHAVRLGYQGIELMETGRLTLPMPLSQRQTVREVKLGKYSQDDVLYLLDTVTARLERHVRDTELPDEPDWDWANQFLIDAYQSAWEIPW